MSVMQAPPTFLFRLDASEEGKQCLRARPAPARHVGIISLAAVGEECHLPCTGSLAELARPRPPAPATGCLVIGSSCFHPPRGLLLPERRLRLQVIHDELARGEGIAAVRAC